MPAGYRPSLNVEATLSEPPSIQISPKAERPLPPLPEERLEPKPQVKSQHFADKPTRSSVASGKARAHSHPSRSSHESLRKILQDPLVSPNLLSQLPWHTFHAFTSTCREFRQLLELPGLRDIILSQYVPGYRSCIGYGTVQQHGVMDINMRDLALLHITQNVPLHRYPMHALSILSSPLYIPNVPPSDRMTIKLVTLAHTHTRFVLLLQSLVHSTHSFTSHIDVDDFSLYPATGASAKTVHGVRELVFPKPLSFFNAADPDLDRENTTVSATKGLRRVSTGRSVTSNYSSYSVPRASRDFPSVLKRTGSRNPLRPVMSVLGGGSQKIPLPPPSMNPPAFSYYVGSWRRTLATRKSGHHSSSVSEDEDEALPKPRFHERRSSSVNRSMESSVGSSSPSSSGSNTEYTDASSVSPKEESKPVCLPAATSSSPHDLCMATSRFRAPVLRVFVPCTELDEFAISACEEQLMVAGLWEHLSAGDIICNFGFVPPPETDSSSQLANSSGKTERTTHRRRWLIFNGYCLVHYIPPSPPPVENSLTLPSPFYFTHILPPYANPRFIFSLPPQSRNSSPTRSVQSRGYPDDPYAQLTLSHVRTRVSSPHSPLGFALVKKYLWLARILYVGPGSGTEAGPALGEGWQGEWVLEAEGTKEGRQTLVDAAKANANGSTPRGLWEVVRDKCGTGRLWMRLIVPNIDCNIPELDNQNISAPRT